MQCTSGPWSYPVWAFVLLGILSHARGVVLLTREAVRVLRDAAAYRRRTRL
jgi:hypothetical protein